MLRWDELQFRLPAAQRRDGPVSLVSLWRWHALMNERSSAWDYQARGQQAPAGDSDTQSLAASRVPPDAVGFIHVVAPPAPATTCLGTTHGCISSSQVRGTGDLLRPVTSADKIKWWIALRLGWVGGWGDGDSIERGVISGSCGGRREGRGGQVLQSRTSIRDPRGWPTRIFIRPLSLSLLPFPCGPPPPVEPQHHRVFIYIRINMEGLSAKMVYTIMPGLS